MGKNTSYREIGATFAGHLTVQHNKRQYANKKTGAHINTAESVNAVVQRALIGVYHRLEHKHLQRYLDEIIWRWKRLRPDEGADAKTFLPAIIVHHHDQVDDPGRGSDAWTAIQRSDLRDAPDTEWASPL